MEKRQNYKPEELNFMPEPGMLAVRPTPDFLKESKIHLSEATRKRIIQDLMSDGTIANEVVSVGKNYDSTPSSFNVGDHVIFDRLKAQQEGGVMSVIIEGCEVVLIPMGYVLGRVKDVPQYKEFEKNFIAKGARLTEAALPPKKTKASDLVDANGNMIAEKKEPNEAKD